eukprot:gene5022-biopygen15328
MQLTLKASPMIQSRIPPLSLRQPRPQWSTAAASRVIRAAQSKYVPVGTRYAPNRDLVYAICRDGDLLDAPNQGVMMSAPLGLGGEEMQRKINKGLMMTLHLVGRQGSRPLPWRALLDALNLEEEHPLEEADHNVKAIRRATPRPAQLMGRIMACTDLSSLDQAITEHGRSFNDRHVSSAMSRVGKLYRRNQVAMAQQMMQDLSVFALRELTNMNARSLSNVLVALSKVGGLVNPAVVQGILTEAKLKLRDFNAQELSNSMWAAAKLGIEDKAFNASWLREAKLKLPDFNAQGLSNSLWAAASLGIVDEAFNAAWLREAKLKLPDFNAQNLSNSLWAAATLGIEDEAFNATWLREAKLMLPDFNAQGLSNSLWAAATLGIEDAAFNATWLHEAKLKLPGFNAQNLSNSLWAAATLGIEYEAFHVAWMREAKLKLTDFNAQNLSNTLWAAATLGIEDAAFNAAWLCAAKLELPDFNVQGLSNSLWAAANLGIKDEAFNAAWLTEAKLKLPGFNAQALFNTLWAAANLGIMDDDFAAAWMRVAKQKLPEFDVQALFNILSSAADRGTTVQVVGDASNKALAAYTPNGELAQPIIQPFSKTELKFVQKGKWSSTARELAVVKLALEVMEEQRPGFLSGKRFQYGTDCEVAVMMMRMVAFPDAPLDSPFLTTSSGKYAHNLATAMGFKGGLGTVPLVKDIRLLCEQLGVELDVVWRRRNYSEQQKADALSTIEDTEDWSLHEGVYLKVLEHPCLEGRRPTLDVFASAANTKVQGAYYSNYLGLGCLGVGAFQHPWVREGSPREEQLAYIHGPYHLLPQILQRVREEQVDCIVITSGLNGPWVALLSGLPVQATMELPSTADLLVAGALVPTRERSKGSKDPLKASFILWGNKQDAQD